MPDLSPPGGPVSLPATPAGHAADFALAVLAGRIELTVSLAEERFAPSFFEDDTPVEELVAQVRALRDLADLVAIDIEVDRLDSIQVLSAGAHGMRRLWARCEPGPPHRITGLLIGDAIEARWTDQRVAGCDGDIYVRRYEGHGPETLLVHGGGCDVTTWDQLVPLVRGHCTAIDLRAHGRSDPHAVFTFAGITDDIARVVAALELDRPTIVGHSLGGHAGLEFASRRNYRGGLVALDGPASLSANKDEDAGVDERWATILGEVRGQDIASLIDRLPAPALFVLCNEFTAGPDQDNLAAAAVAEREELATYLAKRRPDLSVEWLPTGHMLFHSMPDETATLINQFLSSRPI